MLWLKVLLPFQIICILIGFANGAALDKSCIFVFNPKSFNPVIKDVDIKISGANNVNDSMKAQVPNGKTFRLQCSEPDNIFRRLETYSLNLKCTGGTIISTEYRKFRLDGIDCIRDTKPRSQVIRNGTCYNNATKVDIYFKGTDPPYVLYSVCHDEDTSQTLYSESFIDGESISKNLAETGTPRPPFKDTDFYPFDVNEAYKRRNQDEVLATLLGSEAMVKKYIPSDQYYFSRGHLYPNGDPIYKYEKDATFYFINAVPQFQILNAGNWERLESSVRNLAENLQTKLKVWTGTYGVLQLNDENNNLVEIWLSSEPTENAVGAKRRLPVPKFMWKVVYDEPQQAAVAIVQIHNPWTKILTKEDLLCEDICDDIPWIRFDVASTKRGYTYCCDVNDLRKVVKFVPSLNYTRLLDYEEPFGQVTDEDDNESNGDDDDDDDEEEDDEDITSTSDSSEDDDDFERGYLF